MEYQTGGRTNYNNFVIMRLSSSYFKNKQECTKKKKKQLQTPPTPDTKLALADANSHDEIGHQFRHDKVLNRPHLFCQVFKLAKKMPCLLGNTQQQYLYSSLACHGISIHSCLLALFVYISEAEHKYL